MGDSKMNKRDYLIPSWSACVSQIQIDNQMSSSVGSFSSLRLRHEKGCQCVNSPSCTDFKHYTLCHPCVHHLIKQIKPLKNADRIRSIPSSSLSHWRWTPDHRTGPPLLQDHSCQSENPISKQSPSSTAGPCFYLQCSSVSAYRMMYVWVIVHYKAGLIWSLSK